MRCSMTRLLALALLPLVLVACKRDQPAQQNLPAAGPAAPVDGAGRVELEDVVEHTPDYVIGISYPPVARKYPLLAAELKRYAEAARADLLQAVQGKQKGESAGLYDLTLPFTEVVDSPTLVAVAVDGSSYTGGAHGAPLIARWVWLPQQNKRLLATDLVPDAAGWQAIAATVREQLHTALSQRVDADELPPAERLEVLKNASRMIDEGTGPDPANFSQFEPVTGPGGKLVALRFVFAPYQVGPYSDGTQMVEVPAAALLPHVAPAYRSLFQGG